MMQILTLHVLQDADMPDFFSNILLQTFVKDVNDAMESDLMPRAAAVFESVTVLQQDAQTTTDKSGGSKCNV